MSYEFLLTLGIILLSTKLLGMLTGRMHLPQVVGALLAGLLLGPAVFGVLEPSEFLSQLAELGVIVIMFGAGMETSISELRNSGKAGFLVALMGVLVPLGMGVGLMAWFNPSGQVLEWVFMGTILTATSVSITVETLKELGKLSTKVGNVILAAALIDDVLGLICLTMVTSLGGSGDSIGMVLVKIVLFFLVAGVAGFLFSKLLTKLNTGRSTELHRFPVLSFAFCMILAWMAETVFGVAGIIGAFAAGLAVSTTDNAHYIASKFSPLSYLLLTPIFFANIGLEMTFPTMTPELLLFALCLILVAVGSKLVGCGLGTKLCGFGGYQCVQTGLAMACRGEVALIVANKGMALGLISADYFSTVILMVIFCSIATPILLKIAFHGEDAHASLEASSLVDHYEMAGWADSVSQQMLQAEKTYRNPKKADK